VEALSIAAFKYGDTSEQVILKSPTLNLLY